MAPSFVKMPTAQAGNDGSGGGGGKRARSRHRLAFTHPNFRRGCPEELWAVRRKSQPRRKSARAANRGVAAAGTEPQPALRGKHPSSGSPSPHGLPESGPAPEAHGDTSPSQEPRRSSPWAVAAEAVHMAGAVTPTDPQSEGGSLHALLAQWRLQYGALCRGSPTAVSDAAAPVRKARRVTPTGGSFSSASSASPAPGAEARGAYLPGKAGKREKAAGGEDGEEEEYRPHVASCRRMTPTRRSTRVRQNPTLFADVVSSAALDNEDEEEEEDEDEGEDSGEGGGEGWEARRWSLARVGRSPSDQLAVPGRSRADDVTALTWKVVDALEAAAAASLGTGCAAGGMQPAAVATVLASATRLLRWSLQALGQDTARPGLHERFVGSAAFLPEPVRSSCAGNAGWGGGSDSGPAVAVSATSATHPATAAECTPGPTSGGRWTLRPSARHGSDSSNVCRGDAFYFSPYPPRSPVPPLTEAMLGGGELMCGGEGDTPAGEMYGPGDASMVSSAAHSRWGFAPPQAELAMPHPPSLDPWPTAGADEAMDGLPPVGSALLAPPCSATTGARHP